MLRLCSVKPYTKDSFSVCLLACRLNIKPHLPDDHTVDGQDNKDEVAGIGQVQLVVSEPLISKVVTCSTSAAVSITLCVSSGDSLSVCTTRPEVPTERRKPVSCSNFNAVLGQNTVSLYFGIRILFIFSHNASDGTQL